MGGLFSGERQARPATGTAQRAGAGTAQRAGAGTAQRAGAASSERTALRQNDDRMREAPKQVRDGTINLLLVGTVGTGKSITGNKILQLKKDPFQKGDSSCTTTLECQADYARYGEEVIKVVDMPGLSGETAEETCKKQVTEAAMNALVDTPNGFDAFLVVFRHGKQDVATKIAIDELKKMFGNEIFKQYGILVLTHADDFARERTVRNQETYAEYCSRLSDGSIIKNLWKECGERVVSFDNVTQDAEKIKNQKEEIFSLVKQLKSTTRYTPELFKAAQKTYTEMLQKADKQGFTQSVKKRIRLIIHDLEDVNVYDPKSEHQLLRLKDKAEDQEENVLHLHKTNLNAEIGGLVKTLKDTIEMKLKLVDMIQRNQTSTGDRGIDDMNRKLKDQESKLEKEYWSYSRKDTTKMKLKTSLFSRFLS